MPMFKGSYCSRSFDTSRTFIPYPWWTAAEETLTKLGLHVWDLKKLQLGKAQTTSRLVWRQSVIYGSRMVCSQDFISVCTYLYMVWQKDSTGKTASDATGYVYDANAEATSKFLQISHDKELEQNCDNELQQPVIHSHAMHLMCKIIDHHHINIYLY